MNSKMKTMNEPSELILYTGDTFFCEANEHNKEPIRHLELNISDMMHFLQFYQLNVNKRKLNMVVL